MKDQIKRMGSKDFKKKANNATVTELSKEGKLALLEKIAASFEGRPKPKVVVRLLPPRITPHTFLESLEDVAARWNSEDVKVRMNSDSLMTSILWMQLVPGRKVEGREWTKSVAYLVFATRAAAYCFIRAYQGHSFIDHRGSDFKASTGLAAIQRFVVPPTAQPGHIDFEGEIPPEGRWKAIAYYKAHPEALTQPCYTAPDRKIATIENDPSYTRFLERLSWAKSAKTGMQQASAEKSTSPEAADDKVSPLVKSLIDRKLNVQPLPRGRRRSQASLERRGASSASNKAQASGKKGSASTENRAGRGKAAARGSHTQGTNTSGASGLKQEAAPSGRAPQKPSSRRRFRGQVAVPTWRPKPKGSKVTAAGAEDKSPSPDGEQSPQAKAPVVLLKREVGSKKGPVKHSSSGPAGE
eukprot:Blabericola_migrator_1__1674@NODE_144_length_13005_cov_119_784279_g125_i0_p5_GENE_NODE_144_length_13005_cov_119_784279_g125_i0NODE_144_length_13005_cov_119_784279_g125_i0_p5_ORF_typecomplete_len412_score58_36Smg4_UPF3/PF03467_15/1_4e22_NODE_144_length_13005_cov_119_784279_g125_i01095212187